ncbi:MAG: cheB 7 [Firmicutes bacterium]|nr:cheB 7 [Bacillota bacterium]
MKKDAIRVLVVDDVADIRENISKLMEFHSEVKIIGQAGSAAEAIAKAKELQPDIILMDINMPVMDGIAATEVLADEVPQANVIIMSVQGEQEYLRRAMVAGAKNYMVKPFSGDELLQAIKQVYSLAQKRITISQTASDPIKQGKIVTIFSTKGGIGKTTIASNLAVALASNTGAKICIVDADLQFGDVALFLNVAPKATIADLVREADHMDAELITNHLSSYNELVSLLPAPLRPEQAELIGSAQITAILATMRTMFDYIIVDTSPTFNDVMLTTLDAADQILVITSMDLPTIKNVKLCLEIMESLEYSRDKIKVFLNRADSEGGLERREVQESLRYPFAAAMPSDGRTVVYSVNRGIPFVTSHPEAGVSKGIFSLAAMIAGGEEKKPEPPGGVMSKFKRLFG